MNYFLIFSIVLPLLALVHILYCYIAKNKLPISLIMYFYWIASIAIAANLGHSSQAVAIWIVLAVPFASLICLIAWSDYQNDETVASLDDYRFINFAANISITLVLFWLNVGYNLLAYLGVFGSMYG